jgi:hypothetical protein
VTHVSSKRAFGLALVGILGLGACGGGSDAGSLPEPVVETSIESAAAPATAPLNDPTATAPLNDATTDADASDASPATAPVDEPTTVAVVATTPAADESASAVEPAISADEVAALERDLDEIDQLIADIELDLEQD